MVTGFSVPTYSQRDPRWSRQRLGDQSSSTTIGQSGCLITSIAMMNAGFDPSNPLFPNQIDDLFTDNRGYANGNLVVWNAINRLLPNCALTGQVFCPSSPAPVEDIRNHLNEGYLVILQVGFGGIASNMHYVLAIGHNGTDIMFNDPWYGDQSSFLSRRYGNGDSSTDILAVHYFGDAISNEPVKPPTPVAARPVNQPLLGFQRVVLPEANCNYRRAANVESEVIKMFDAGTVLDFKGFVHGQSVNDSDIWFVGRYSDGYAHSHNFTDTDTHDLPDLTPAPAPEVAPDPIPEPAPEVSSDLEWVRTWVLEDISPKVVAVPQADIFDPVTDTVIGHLSGGEPVKKLAGHYTLGGQEYVRTQWSLDNNKWNGILLSSLKEPPIISDPGVPVDAIQPPPTVTPENLFDDLEPIPGEAATIVIPLTQKLSSLWEIVLGVILTPLRLIGFIKSKGEK